jgi:hypothetical protein
MTPAQADAAGFPIEKIVAAIDAQMLIAHDAEKAAHAKTKQDLRDTLSELNDHKLKLAELLPK